MLRWQGPLSMPKSVSNRTSSKGLSKAKEWEEEASSCRLLFRALAISYRAFTQAVFYVAIKRAFVGFHLPNACGANVFGNKTTKRVPTSSSDDALRFGTTAWVIRASCVYLMTQDLITWSRIGARYCGLLIKVCWVSGRQNQITRKTKQRNEFCSFNHESCHLAQFTRLYWLRFYWHFDDPRYHDGRGNFTMVKWVGGWVGEYESWLRAKP